MSNIYERFPELVPIKMCIDNAISTITNMHRNGGKLLLCGNGGSSSDCDHIVGELMKSFVANRNLSEHDSAALKNSIREFADAESADKFTKKLQYGVPAISLSSQAAIFTAYVNDVAADMIYAQLLYVLAKKGDVLFAISTSGNSVNVVNAVTLAKAVGIKTIALTGENGGKLASLCDIAIKAPASETYRVQEYHLPVYHHICLGIEREFFAK